MEHQRNNFPKDPISEALYFSELMFCLNCPGGRQGEGEEGFLSPACSTVSNPDQVALFSFPSLHHSHRVAP